MHRVDEIRLAKNKQKEYRAKTKGVSITNAGRLTTSHWSGRRDSMFFVVHYFPLLVWHSPAAAQFGLMVTAGSPQKGISWYDLGFEIRTLGSIHFSSPIEVPP